MGARANELADRFEGAVNDLAAFIEQCPDETWQAVRGPEEWTVGQLAQHVSGQFPMEMEYITAAADGKALPSYSWDDINSKNDGRAAKNASVSKQQVLDELKSGAASTAKYLRGLSDEQLDRKGSLALANGASVSTQQLIEGGVLIDHVQGHLATMRNG
jgi:DinB family protein